MALLLSREKYIYLYITISKMSFYNASIFILNYMAISRENLTMLHAKYKGADQPANQHLVLSLHGNYNSITVKPVLNGTQK